MRQGLDPIGWAFDNQDTTEGRTMTDLTTILYHDDDGSPDERLVQLYLEQVRKGIDLPAPLLVKQANGRYRPLDTDSASKIEAKQRHGLVSTDAYVIEEQDPEKLKALRRAFKAACLGRA
jgi:hypothetical protein